MSEKRITEVFENGVQDVQRSFDKCPIERIVAKRIFEHGFITGVIATISSDDEVIIPSQMNFDE